MNILTLNCTITQLRCRVLSHSIEYEAMINNQWLPVTHKFAEIVWDNFHLKQRMLVTPYIAIQVRRLMYEH